MCSLGKGSVTAAVEWVPSYLSVTLFYDPWISSYEEISVLLLQHLRQLHQEIQPNELNKQNIETYEANLSNQREESKALESIGTEISSKW